MRDPFLDNVPEDDEPVSADEMADLAEARRALQAGLGISLENYLGAARDLEEWGCNPFDED